MAMEAVAIARKFTMKALGLDNEALKEIVANNKGEVEIFNVLALVASKKVEPNRKDPTKTSIRFFGQFDVTNRITGEAGVFPEGYFPGVCESFLSSQKDAAGEGAVRVPFVITIKKDLTPNSAQGYIFGCKAYVDKEAGADPFADIRDVLPKVTPMKSLAAPEAKKGKK